MANRYDHHHNIQHHHQHQKPIFLPIFCRLSIKDINLNSHYKIPQPSSDEPSSPKVSCMGQVKRNNRVIAFPAATTAAINHHKKYTKRQKMFSNKTLLTNPTSTKSGSKSCRTSREMCASSRKFIKARNECHNSGGDHVKVVIDIGEMDPPLPVVKRVAPPRVGRDEVNIWKRRFNGEGLKRLQIQQIHMPNTKFQPPTTV